uniref:Uncharacterized protein n=1 Tax=Romanomermis culicivorax TaxID=13658 RepID=A0A915KVH5_ROMCU
MLRRIENFILKEHGRSWNRDTTKRLKIIPWPRKRWQTDLHTFHKANHVAMAFQICKLDTNLEMPTNSFHIDISIITKRCGYTLYYFIEKIETNLLGISRFKKYSNDSPVCANLNSSKTVGDKDDVTFKATVEREGYLG